MKASGVTVEDILSIAAECLAEGCPDIAIDHYLLAYRQGVSDIVADMHEYDCPRISLGPRWSEGAAWIGWASLSLHHRAVREGYDGVKFFDDLVPGSSELVLYGRYWVDEIDMRGRKVRVILPDAYCHILVQLATREVFRKLLPVLINNLLDVGRWAEAKRHAADHAVLLIWR